MKEGQGFSRKVTLETLEKFAPLLRRIKEKLATTIEDENEKTRAPEDPELNAAEALFKGSRFKVRIPFKPPIKPSRPTKLKKRKEKRERKKEEIIVTPAPAIPSKEQGAILWKKRLAASDVQSQAGHPTGGIRLTQADWKVGGKLIDQTTYFRNTIFKDLLWKVVKQRPFTEAAKTKFNVTILGKPYGVHSLEVRHKPSGEAGQGNYTTILTWKDLGNKIKGLNLTGRTLEIYSPPKGTTEPFFIDIS